MKMLADEKVTVRAQNDQPNFCGRLQEWRVR